MTPRALRAALPLVGALAVQAPRAAVVVYNCTNGRSGPCRLGGSRTPRQRPTSTCIGWVKGHPRGKAARQLGTISTRRLLVLQVLPP